MLNLSDNKEEDTNINSKNNIFTSSTIVPSRRANTDINFDKKFLFEELSSNRNESQ